MTFPPELLDELLKDYRTPEDLLGNSGILKQLTAALVERCLNAEMKTHLEEEQVASEIEGKKSRNRRNGPSKKTYPAGSKLQRGVWGSPDQHSPRPQQRV